MDSTPARVVSDSLGGRARTGRLVGGLLAAFAALTLAFLFSHEAFASSWPRYNGASTFDVGGASLRLSDVHRAMQATVVGSGLLASVVESRRGGFAASVASGVAPVVGSWVGQTAYFAVRWSAGIDVAESVLPAAGYFTAGVALGMAGYGLGRLSARAQPP